MLRLSTLTTSLFASAESSGGGEKHHFISFEGLFVYVAITLALIFFVAFQARKGINNRFFTNWYTQRAEQLYLFIQNMCVGIIGPHGKKYAPMMITFWLVIFFSNAVGLFTPYAPTADLGWNLGMALIAIGYVQYEGIKANGFFGHLSHFAGPKLGIGLIPITIMIFVIELISEVMKNVSLSLRLYGNIHGGHEAVVAMNNLGKDIFVPVGFFLMPIKFLTCIVQALIFTLLTCVYISLVTAHHGDDHGHDEHHDEPALAH